MKSDLGKERELAMYDIKTKRMCLEDQLEIFMKSGGIDRNEH